MPPGPHDYYRTLGVPRTASTDQIRRAHRKLARRYHPDFNPGDKFAEERFKNIQEAYDVLIDADARRRYDQTAFHPEPGAAGTPVGTTGDASPHPATDVGSPAPRERIHKEAAGDVGLREIFYPPRSEREISTASEIWLAVLVLTFLWGGWRFVFRIRCSGVWPVLVGEGFGCSSRSPYCLQLVFYLAAPGGTSWLDACS